MNQFQELQKDLQNHDLPRNLHAYNKLKTTLEPGTRIAWYFEDERIFWEAEGINPYVMTQYQGIIIPVPDCEMRGRELEPGDCVVVQINYPCEKCYPEVVWFTLNRLLDNPELVEIFSK